MGMCCTQSAKLSNLHPVWNQSQQSRVCVLLSSSDQVFPTLPDGSQSSDPSSSTWYDPCRYLHTSNLVDQDTPKTCNTVFNCPTHVFNSFLSSFENNCLSSEWTCCCYLRNNCRSLFVDSMACKRKSFDRCLLLRGFLYRIFVPDKASASLYISIWYTYHPFSTSRFTLAVCMSLRFQCHGLDFHFPVLISTCFFQVTSLVMSALSSISSQAFWKPSWPLSFHHYPSRQLQIWDNWVPSYAYIKNQLFWISLFSHSILLVF